MARLNYALKLKKQEVRDTYYSLARKEKKAFAKRFDETDDLDEVLTWKTKKKTSNKTTGKTGRFRTRDEMLIDSGWTPEPAVANSPFGLRQVEKVNNIIKMCEKMGGTDWVRSRKK